MNIKSLLGAATIAIAVASPGLAAPIDLDFSFAGVSGTFFGLDNADGVSSASSVNFGGAFDSYLLDSAGAVSNAFTFSAGSLTDMAFSYSDPVIGTGVTGILDNFDCSIDSCTSRERTIPLAVTTIFTFSAPVFAIRPISAVPLPAGGLLIVSGLVGLAGLRRVSQRFRAKRPRRSGASRRVGP